MRSHAEYHLETLVAETLGELSGIQGNKLHVKTLMPECASLLGTPRMFWKQNK